MAEPKKGIGLVIQIGKPMKKEADKAKDALTQAAEDLIASVADKDVEGVKSALESAYLYCDSQDEDEGQEQSDKEE